MRKSAVLGAAAAALAAGALAVPMAFTSSHEEAPGIKSLGPQVDNTDVWAWVTPDARDKLTVVANVNPLREPGGGPYYDKLNPKAKYRINVDNTGDGLRDISYVFRIKNQIRDPNSFLYAKGPVTSPDDPDLNFRQTYDLYKETYDRNNRLRRVRQLANDAPTAPSFAGPKTNPNYEQTSNAAVRNVGRGTTAFVGPSNDMFFVGLNRVFDLINLEGPPNIGLGNQGGADDTVSRYNASSFVLQIPQSELTVDGRPVRDMKAKNAVVGVWSSVDLKTMDVLGNSSRRRQRGPRWQQVSTLGQPLINEVFNGLGYKDKYNSLQPGESGRRVRQFVRNPQLGDAINALFGTKIPTQGRGDLEAVLLTGIPGLTQIGNKPNVPNDALRINMGVPPAANPTQFGVLAGDNSGYPNGRHPRNDIVDIQLRALSGALLPDQNGGLPLGDGVDQDDAPLRSAFPYVPLPKSGFPSPALRTEPTHAPIPAPVPPGT
jgi:hypothetical protein